jgi:hypothetical protein
MMGLGLGAEEAFVRLPCHRDDDILNVALAEIHKSGKGYRPLLPVDSNQTEFEAIGADGLQWRVGLQTQRSGSGVGQRHSRLSDSPAMVEQAQAGKNEPAHGAPPRSSLRRMLAKCEHRLGKQRKKCGTVKPFGWKRFFGKSSAVRSLRGES